MVDHKLKLGQETGHPDKYAPEVLDAISRSRDRERLGIAARLPFTGVDVWNAWELTWLGKGGRPAAATARIVVPVESPNIIESKPLQPNLNTPAFTALPSAGAFYGHTVDTTAIDACYLADVFGTSALGQRKCHQISLLPYGFLDFR